MAALLSPPKLPIQSGDQKSSSERGVFIVMGALWMGMFIALIALALDTFMIATAKMHQSSTVEYIAMGTLRTLKEPPTGASYQGSPGDDVGRYNSAISRGALAGTVTLPGSSAAQVLTSQMQVRAAVGSDDDDEYCDDSSPAPCSGVSVSNQCSDVDRWCGFESASPVGAVIFGVYTPASGGTPASFVPANSGSSAGVNAVKVRLQLQDPNVSPFVLPFGKFLLGDGAVSFQSTAIAVYDAPGQYRLVR